MTLEEMTDWLLDQASRHETVIRLQTGDPGLYGALIEMTQPLTAAGVEWAVVPGVSSAMASMAAAGESLTLPEVTQTVILTRTAGRTPMPEGEDLEALASHHCTLCIYLSITLLHEVQKALRAAGWREDAPILVVQKASWPGQEKIVRGTLADIKQKCQAEKIGSQAMIVASPTLGAADWESLVRSKLYDPTFTHRFRKASERPPMTNPENHFLLAGHGSRNRDGNDEIEHFAAQWRAKHPDWRIEVCFIEHADVLLNDGLDHAAKGAATCRADPLHPQRRRPRQDGAAGRDREARERHPASSSSSPATSAWGARSSTCCRSSSTA
jgi:precorrin-4/cobalt-precorrin-4 C11-methyltransferase